MNQPKTLHNTTPTMRALFRGLLILKYKSSVHFLCANQRKIFTFVTKKLALVIDVVSFQHFFFPCPTHSKLSFNAWLFWLLSLKWGAAFTIVGSNGKKKKGILELNPICKAFFVAAKLLGRSLF